jgi:hypothetical protein
VHVVSVPRSSRQLNSVVSSFERLFFVALLVGYHFAGLKEHGW